MICYIFPQYILTCGQHGIGIDLHVPTACYIKWYYENIEDTKAVIRSRKTKKKTDNTIAKRKRTKNDLTYEFRFVGSVTIFAKK